MVTPPIVVTVAAITFKRPGGLAKMLEQLARQRARQTTFSFHVLIVDNDAERSAEPVVMRAIADHGLDIRYVVEAIQGIPPARNRALKSMPPEADYFCFIDDDEWPAEDWLDQLLGAMAATAADCVHGPVEPMFPAGAPKWAMRSGIFDRRRHGDLSTIDFGATNNIMISARFLRESGLLFDERMRFTGGSDFFFFLNAQKLGLRIVWADRAVVFEDIPFSRLEWRWILLRHYRIGNTYALSDVLGGGLWRRVRRIFIALARLGFGALLMPLGAIAPKYAIAGIRHVVRAAGMIAGVIGDKRQEYAPAQLVKDRAH